MIHRTTNLTPHCELCNVQFSCEPYNDLLIKVDVFIIEGKTNYFTLIKVYRLKKKSIVYIACEKSWLVNLKVDHPSLHLPSITCELVGNRYRLQGSPTSIASRTVSLLNFSFDINFSKLDRGVER